MTIKDLRDEVEGDDSSRKRAERELEKLKETIAEKLSKLEEIRPRYEAQKKREEECTREYVKDFIINIIIWLDGVFLFL